MSIYVWDQHGVCKGWICFKLRMIIDHFRVILTRYYSLVGKVFVIEPFCNNLPNYISGLDEWYQPAKTFCHLFDISDCRE